MLKYTYETGTTNTCIAFQNIEEHDPVVSEGNIDFPHKPDCSVNIRTIPEVDVLTICTMCSFAVTLYFFAKKKDDTL